MSYHSMSTLTSAANQPSNMRFVHTSEHVTLLSCFVQADIVLAAITVNESRSYTIEINQDVVALTYVLVITYI